jgi:hypothetical protein
MELSEKIKNIISEQGLDYKEKDRTIYTMCPICGQSDKFSILKANGHCICYRGSCEFGKRRFVDWLILTANIGWQEAKAMMQEVDYDYAAPEGGLKFAHPDEGTFMIAATPVEFPENHMIKISSAMSSDGQLYLTTRGITVSLAEKYGIMYSPSLRRVIFPITIDGKNYGYQGRHIDKVPDSQKMRNNEGFAREALVMFMDQVKDNFVIICEGPVDAIKFDKVGGNVATMGKAVTQKQRELMMSKGIQNVYLALDEDAEEEIYRLQREFGGANVFQLRVPESCKIRCQAIGKKADFGECTFDECVEAFNNPIALDGSNLIINFR